jgi:hypothetical protein
MDHVDHPPLQPHLVCRNHYLLVLSVLRPEAHLLALPDHESLPLQPTQRWCWMVCELLKSPRAPPHALSAVAHRSRPPRQVAQDLHPPRMQRLAHPHTITQGIVVFRQMLGKVRSVLVVI